MIIDVIQNAKQYYNLNDNIKKGLEFIEKTDFSKIKDGKINIEGDKIYANLQTYMTKEENSAKYEAHKNYIDIQYLIDGEEKLAYANLEDFIATEYYDEKKDIIFGVAKGDFVSAKQGNFLIFYPQDAHKPSIAINNPQNVRKVVVKIAI